MPQPQPAQRLSPVRRVLLAAGAAVALVWGAVQLDTLFRGGLNAPVDFAAFWAAGYLAAEGENPYSGDRLRDAQASVGLTDLAVIAWNPPWTLALLMPFSAVPFRSAYGLWVVVHLALIAASAVLLWRAFGGPKKLAWVAVLLALTFVPTVFLIGNAQLTAVVLFGLAGFAAACRADRPFLAGAALALVATKPHLAIPLGVWLLCSACRSAFGRRVLVGALAAGALMCVPPALAVPHVWGDYVAAVTGPPDPRIRPLAEWKPPLLGWWARQAVPGAPFWVQWLPGAVAALAVAAWCVRSRVRFTPAEALRHLPWLAGLSLLVAPYGAWSYDLVLLLVPVLALAARLATAPNRRAILAGVAILAVVNAVSLVMMLSAASSEWYAWFAPCVLGAVWWLRRPNPPAPFPLREGGELALRVLDDSEFDRGVKRPLVVDAPGRPDAAPPPSLLGKGAGGLGSAHAGSHP